MRPDFTREKNSRQPRPAQMGASRNLGCGAAHAGSTHVPSTCEGKTSTVVRENESEAPADYQSVSCESVINREEIKRFEFKAIARRRLSRTRVSKNRCCSSEKSIILPSAPAGPALLQLLPLAPADPISENRTFRVRTSSSVRNLANWSFPVIAIGHTGVPNNARIHGHGLAEKPSAGYAKTVKE